MDLLGDSVAETDHTTGFGYFDVRDPLGFVDGTASPTGREVDSSVIVTAQDDAAGAEGSYIVVQKYLHDLRAWRSLKAEQQEAIIGRTKLGNIELDDSPDGQQQPHKTLATITDDEENEYSILRDKMPFGDPSAGKFGTYVIGYTRRVWVIKKMLERMFMGDPPGLHDRLLDFSRPVTGTTFFAPSASLLAGLGEQLVLALPLSAVGDKLVMPLVALAQPLNSLISLAPRHNEGKSSVPCVFDLLDCHPR